MHSSLCVIELSSHYFNTALCHVVFQLNAMANRAAGKGYENTGFYNNVTYQFIGIQNIHIMRESLQKLVEGDTPSNIT